MIKKKYRLRFSDFKSINFIVFRFMLILITLLFLISILMQTIAFIFYSIPLTDDFGPILIFLIPLGVISYTTWKEFRCPVLWLSNQGITVRIMVFIPVKVTVSWENVLALKEIFTPHGAPLGNGLLVVITPSDDRQRRIFKISGENSIYISSQIQKYDELVSIISEKTNLPVK